MYIIYIYMHIHSLPYSLEKAVLRPLHYPNSMTVPEDEPLR